MRLLLILVGLALLTFCSADRDRSSPESGMIASDTTAPNRGDSAATIAALTPAAILSQLYLANTSEIGLAELAAKKAATPQVKRIARKLATARARSSEDLMALAQRLALPLTPERGGSVSAADSVARPLELRARTGVDFDRAFILYEINAHQSNIGKIRTQLLPATRNAQVRTYLEKTLAEMEAHLASLKQAQQQLSS